MSIYVETNNNFNIVDISSEWNSISCSFCGGYLLFLHVVCIKLVVMYLQHMMRSITSTHLPVQNWQIVIG